MIHHPEHRKMEYFWRKYRYTFEGGYNFIQMYLKKFSSREEQADFNLRKGVTYCPAHAKAAIVDVKNSIYQRMFDISRDGGTSSYSQAIKGLNRGVDLQDRKMTTFIGTKILPELLALGKVGVYVDNFKNETGTLLDGKEKHPYLYYYTAEQIYSWSYGSDNLLDSLLLEDSSEAIDPVTGLVVENVEQYRLLNRTPEGITVKFLSGEITEEGSYTEYKPPVLLNLPEIPFVIFSLTHSLLTDVADYQIALLNLESSDISYAIKSNFPFYTEQISAMGSLPGLQKDSQKTTGADSIKTGVAQGRAYSKGLDRPGFIHPSPEPLRVSMEKEQAIKKDIRELINLSIASLESRSVSADSKKQDQKGLEAGLSYIGLELEHGEQSIARLWAMYEKSNKKATVKYPESYELKTESERFAKAKILTDLLPKIPSLTYQKELAKEVAEITVGHQVSVEKMEQIEKEIDRAVVVAIDPDVIRQDKEAGLIDDATASKARLYPEDSYLQAQKDHAARLARIAEAQSSHKNDLNPNHDMGIPDLKTGNAKLEKQNSQDPTLDPNAKKKVRGNAQ